jgi:hypothetical protein
MAFPGWDDHTLIDERMQWLRRIQATRYHHGISAIPEQLRILAGRAFLDTLDDRPVRRSPGPATLDTAGSDRSLKRARPAVACAQRTV